MGASYSSEEEGGEEVAGGVTKNIVSEEHEDNVIHKPREEGDGMERPPEAAVTSDNNLEDCDNTENKCDNNEAGGLIMFCEISKIDSSSICCILYFSIIE